MLADKPPALRLGSNGLFLGPRFVLALSGIRRPLVQIKAIEKDDLVRRCRSWGRCWWTNHQPSEADCRDTLVVTDYRDTLQGLGAMLADEMGLGKPVQTRALSVQGYLAHKKLPSGVPRTEDTGVPRT